jgi:hypothetical protein
MPLEPMSAGAGVVVVNEIAAGSYIELHNVSMSTVDIGGFELWLCDPSELTGAVRIALDQRLSGGEFYLIGTSSFTGATVDQVYAGVFPGGGVVLRNPEQDWADGVAVVAESPCGEGAPAPACQGRSTARDAVSTDSGRNAADFSCRWRSPRQRN